MTVSDRARKILWGRSGNRCAICRQELVASRTDTDDESVVGEECHIISPRPSGPRHDPSYPLDKLDQYDNLLLLCRNHHKMIDDQANAYTPDILRLFKTNHEFWVSSQLAPQPERPRARFVRRKEAIPDFLLRIRTGRDLLRVLQSGYAIYQHFPEPETREEVEMFGGFFQSALDWPDLADGTEPGVTPKAEFDLGQEIKELEAAGYGVFAGREIQVLEGPPGGPEDWPVIHLAVVKLDTAGKPLEKGEIH